MFLFFFSFSQSTGTTEGTAAAGATPTAAGTDPTAARAAATTAAATAATRLVWDSVGRLLHVSAV